MHKACLYFFFAAKRWPNQISIILTFVNFVQDLFCSTLGIAYLLMKIFKYLRVFLKNNKFHAPKDIYISWQCWKLLCFPLKMLTRGFACLLWQILQRTTTLQKTVRWQIILCVTKIVLMVSCEVLLYLFFSAENHYTLKKRMLVFLGKKMESGHILLAMHIKWLVADKFRRGICSPQSSSLTIFVPGWLYLFLLPA